MGWHYELNGPLSPSRAFRPDILLQADEIYRDTQRVMKYKRNADWGRHGGVFGCLKTVIDGGCQGHCKNGKSRFTRSLSPNLLRPSCITQHAHGEAFYYLLTESLSSITFDESCNSQPEIGSESEVRVIKLLAPPYLVHTNI